MRPSSSRRLPVISGIDIQDPAGLADLTGKSGFGDAGPALQISVPGSADAVVATYRALGVRVEKPTSGNSAANAILWQTTGLGASLAVQAAQENYTVIATMRDLAKRDALDRPPKPRT